MSDGTYMNPFAGGRFRVSVLPAMLLGFSLLWTYPLLAAPAAELWPRWQAAAEKSSITVDHLAWDEILNSYLMTDHPSGINRFSYSLVSREDKEKLNRYLDMLQQEKVSLLLQIEQKAYWINLYNALTIKVILDHYPVDSITDIDISPGFFSNGPWDADLLTIEGERISLNDIEHRILRPIFDDNRVHYALNCASLGCPDLQPVAFTAANTEQLLDKAARQYINHPRGVEINTDLILSSIYKWFRADFGGTEQGVIQHLLLYSHDDLSRLLRHYSTKIRYRYDWALNE